MDFDPKALACRYDQVLVRLGELSREFESNLIRQEKLNIALETQVNYLFDRMNQLELEIDLLKDSATVDEVNLVR